MRRIIVLVGFALIAIFSGPRRAAAAEDCHLKQLTSVPLTVEADSVDIPVTVRGTPVMMRLHLSAAFSLIWLSGGRNQLNLHQDSLPFSQAYLAGRRITQAVKVDLLQIGDVQVNEDWILAIDATAASLRSPNELPMAGEIGMDLFANVDFELDLKHRKLNLFSTDHCPGRVVYWSDTVASTPIKRGPAGNAYFPMDLDGRKVATAFSTGATYSTLTTDVTRRLYGFDEHSADIKTDPGPDGRSMPSYRAMTLRGPGLDILNAKIVLLPPARGCDLRVGLSRKSIVEYEGCAGGEAPLHLGMDVLQRLRLYFAMKENMLYFTDAEDERAATATSPLAPEY